MQSGETETPTEGFTLATSIDQVKEDSMIGVTIKGKPILLSRIGDNFYAMDAVCSHLYGYLPKGTLQEKTVICPVHKAQFDLTNGKVVKNVPRMIKYASHKEASDLTTYRVKVVGSNLLIAL